MKKKLARLILVIRDLGGSLEILLFFLVIAIFWSVSYGILLAWLTSPLLALILSPVLILSVVVVLYYSVILLDFIFCTIPNKIVRWAVKETVKKNE